ncbi:hypothetical protein RI054_20g89830 [Pseudoscourfieldia marina]
MKNIRRDVAASAARTWYTHTQAVLHGRGVEKLQEESRENKALQRKNTRLAEVIARRADDMGCQGPAVRMAVDAADSYASTYLKDKPVALSVWRTSQENARRDKRGRRWPAAVIAFAFALLAQCNRRTYEEIRQVLCLPCVRTATEHKAAMAREADGVQFGVLRSMSRKLILHESKQSERGILCFDSCKIKGNLLYDVHARQVRGLAGKCDLSVVTQSMESIAASAAGASAAADDELQKTRDHLVVYWVSLESSNANIVARYNRPSITAEFLIREIDIIMRDLMTYGMDVVATACDAAGENRSWWNAVGTQRSDGAYVFEHMWHGRDVVVLPDMPHVIKRLRNALESSSSLTSSRSLRFRQEEVSLDVLKYAWKLSGGCEVSSLTHGGEDGKCPLSRAHFKLDAFSRMRVPLAMQVFGKRAQFCLKQHGVGPRYAMLALMEVIDELVDYCNGRSDDAGALTRCRALMDEWRAESTTSTSKLPPELCDDFNALCAGVAAIVADFPDCRRRLLQQDICEHHFNNARHSAGGSQALDERSANAAAATSMHVRLSRGTRGNCSSSPFAIDEELNVALPDTRECDIKRKRY